MILAIDIGNTNIVVGCIDEQDILGKVLLCFLPISDFGVVK